MRNVDDRIQWYLNNKPSRAGYCANHMMRALDVPPQGYPDATAVARRVESDGHMLHGPVPRGAIMYWDQGSGGHGHVAPKYDWGSAVASVDVDGPATVGIKQFGWFNTNWPTLRYLGWSWWWGGINTNPKEVAVPAYTVKKVAADQRIALNKWVKLDLGTKDEVQPPVGSNDWDTYINLDLTSLQGASRNDLRYVLGRWARHDVDSNDLITMGGEKVDVTGADTKAIPPDLPKGSIRFSWNHDFKGEAGVPVSFWVYIGSMKDGSIVSPLRIFKIDDETT